MIKMKNCNIFEVHWKTRRLGGRGGLGKKDGGGIFEEGWYPNAHYVGFMASHCSHEIAYKKDSLYRLSEVI